MARVALLSEPLISFIVKKANNALAPYQKMLIRVLSGDITLKELLDKIRADKDAAFKAEEIRKAVTAIFQAA
ncbi:MAG: hypothetical protein ABH843_01855 [Candidatus Omnitrophota bacterium]